MLWRMSVDSHRQRIGIMFACLDDRLHRPRSRAQPLGAPAVDFPAPCGAKVFPVATGDARAIPCRHSRRAELSGRRALGATAKSRRGGKVETLRQHYPQSCCLTQGAVPSAIGEALAEIAEIAGMGPGGSPQPWIPASGGQHFANQCFFAQSFQALGDSRAIILRAAVRCHRTVTSS
jgi:hypothetical protein